MGMWTPEREKSEDARTNYHDHGRSLNPWRRLLVVSLVAAATLGIVRFASDERASTTVTMEAQASIKGDTLAIRGRTNLPDGAILTYETIDGPTGRMRVRDGAFSTRVEADGRAFDGINELRILFEIVMTDGVQPPHIIRQFGGFGEYLGGPLVREEDHGAYVEVEVMVTR